MAVGISCAGTGMREAQQLVQPLLTDAADFVRQGAFVATALIMLQQPESQARPYLPGLIQCADDPHYVQRGARAQKHGAEGASARI